jgi:hypothetical protein
MEKSLPLFAAHVGVGIAEHESDCSEKVTLSRPVTPDDDIGPRGERLYNCLVFVTMARKVLLANPKAQTP